MEPEVLEAARVLSRLGLVTAYGHVSVRTGEYVAITPAADLATVAAAGLVRIPLGAYELPPGAPAEAWVHLAVYQARPDVTAIARAQPPSAFVAAAVAAAAGKPSGSAAAAGEPGGSGSAAAAGPAAAARSGAGGAAGEPATSGAAVVGEVAALYGQAAWLGAAVPVHGSALLLRSRELAGAAAGSLGDADALLLRGNGALTVGPSPGIAVARMWLLAAACEAYLAATAAAAGKPAALTADEIASWRAVQDELLPRLWQHLRRRDS